MDRLRRSKSGAGRTADELSALSVWYHLRRAER
jgi:hypothetical protein